MARYCSACFLNYKAHDNANMATTLEHLAMYGEPGAGRLFWMRSTLTGEFQGE